MPYSKLNHQWRWLKSGKMQLVLFILECQLVVYKKMKSLIF
jgi:hypothetical protein